MMKAVRHVALHAGVDDLQVVHGPAAPENHGHGHGFVSGPRDTPTTTARLPSRPSAQNAPIPPVTFPGGRNPYLDRPLPIPPPPKAVMPARPSTSSGPSTRSPFVAAAAAEGKRMSKDDMALNGRIEMNREKKGLQPYIIGIKGPGPLTPEPSPGRSLRTPSPAPIRSIPPRMPTPESLYSGEIPIGMALGSPSHASFIASPLVSSPLNSGGWQPAQIQKPVVIEDAYTPPPVLPIQQPQFRLPTPEPVVQRTKTQKRRLFASLFGGKKHAEQPKAMEKAEANLSTVSITVTGPSGEAATPARSNTVGGKNAVKHKPIIIRSNTISSPSRPNFRMDERLDTYEPVPSIPSSAMALPSSPSGLGLLDIEIPDVRLERYSIMFSGVLTSNGAGSRPKSSLLERRQATLEKLKTINDEQETDRVRPPQRRATSPQPTKSPGFTLFPHTGAAASTTSLQILPNRRLARSNTSPAHLPSPSRASFDSRPLSEKQVQRAKKTVTIVSPRAMEDRNRAAHVEKLREQQQQQQQQQQLQSHLQPHFKSTNTSTTSFHRFVPDESSLILDSPNSFSTFSTDSDPEDDEPDVTVPISIPHPRAARVPVSEEPQWQMISPPSSDSSASTKRTVMSSESTSSLSTRPSLDSVVISVPQVEEDDAALKAAVEISIARQISISRQQRKMLLGGSTMSSGIRGQSGPAAAMVGSNVTVGIVKGRVVETKLAVPTLVVAGGKVMGGHRIRKSEVGELIDV